jgi:hypothetical protein
MFLQGTRICVTDQTRLLRLNLSKQVFADKSLVEPTRYLANEIAPAGQPVWLYGYA